MKNLNHKKSLWLFLLLTLLQGGCSTRQHLPVGPKYPADFPEQSYLNAATDPEKHVYKIDNERSLLTLRVYRGGLMARLGHDHVIASHNVQGYIALNQTGGQCQADIFVPLTLLIVDDPQLRAAANLGTAPSENDIANTKTNMLKSIDAKNFPFVKLLSEDCSAGLSGHRIPVELTFHGINQRRNLQIKMEEINDERLVISGEFSINQTAFDIEPFSVMGGLLKVMDKVDISYQLTAQRITR